MNHSIFKLLLLPIVCSLLMVGHAMAEVRAGAFTVTPMAGYHVIDGGMDLDNSAAYGLGLGYNVSPEWAVEADLRYTPTETDSGNSDDLDIWTISIGGLYHFNPEAVLNPYVSFGAGLMVYDLDNTSSDDEDAFGYYGAGIKYSLSESTDFRLDARHILDYRSDNSGSTHDDSDWRHHLQAMAGFTFQFGGTSAIPVKQEQYPVPELTPEPVAKKEVKAPVAKKKVKAPVDSDHDGVLDPQDECLGTAPGVRVDKDGCPADTDGDGVADYQDACVDTPKGAKVDQNGCPEAAEEVADLTINLLFGFDKDQVTPFHYSELRKVVAFADLYPAYPVIIEGYADDRGPTEYNQDLSQRRADNVRKALIKKYGFSASHISAVGFGEVQPLAGNDIVDERSNNRRVVINLRP
ncbi:MAG: hypothetical protein DRH08_06215 [Deltaproteobacteria bacterium]|nr:MAG: hypothetical protein DRH08_06215 [Deltaproteobacteria bacterium]